MTGKRVYIWHIRVLSILYSICRSHIVSGRKGAGSGICTDEILLSIYCKNGAGKGGGRMQSSGLWGKPSLWWVPWPVYVIPPVSEHYERGDIRSRNGSRVRRIFGGAGASTSFSGNLQKKMQKTKMQRLAFKQALGLIPDTFLNGHVACRRYQHTWKSAAWRLWHSHSCRPGLS